MDSSIGRRVVVLLAAALLVTCQGTGPQSTGAISSVPATSSTAVANSEVPLASTLTGSGATLAALFYEEVIKRYRAIQPAVEVGYAGGGSGRGRRDLRDSRVDWAGSDVFVSAEDSARYAREFLYVPTVAAPIAVTYNLPGVTDLKLDADTIARIFQRDITQWNHRAIADLNVGTALPPDPITVVHRSDSSGTTEQFTQFLVIAASGVWRLRSASTIEWPVATVPAEGNRGIASAIATTPGAIGYVDLADAVIAGLRSATVRNRSGTFVAPTVAGAGAALTSSRLKADLSFGALDTDGSDVYPITAPTWILVYVDQQDPARAMAMRSFLRFLLTEGQTLAEGLNYASLPHELQQKALGQVERIRSG